MFSDPNPTTRFTEGVLHVPDEYTAKRNTQVRTLGFLYAQLVSMLKQVPSRRINTQTLKDCYVYARPREAQGADDGVPAGHFLVNRSEETANDFLRHLIKGANTSAGRPDREISFDYTTPESGAPEHVERILLTGKRGCGKTMFLNQLMMTQRSALEQNGVVWLRVNLTTPLQGWSLMERVYHRCLVSLREHYILDDDEIQSSAFPQLKLASFSRYLQTRCEKRQGRMLNSLFYRIQSIDDRSHLHPIVEPAEIYEEPVPQKLFDLAVDYIIDECGHSLIVILDGLDLLEPTTSTKDEFATWIQQAQRFFRKRDKFCKVLCQRDETYAGFSRELKAPGRPVVSWFSAKVGFPDPQQVLVRRFQAVLAAGRNGADSERIGTFQAIFAALIGYISEGLSIPDSNLALQRVYELVDQDGRRYLHVLRMILARLFYHVETNARAGEREDARIWKNALDGFFQIHPSGTWTTLTPAKYPHQWKTLFVQKSYDVIETMTIGEYRFHHAPFQYKVSDGKMVVTPELHFTFDAGPFPNLFSFSIDLVNAVGQENQAAVLLAKPLMITYLKACEFTPGSAIHKVCMLDILSTKLKIPSLAVEAALHELSFYGLVEVLETRGLVVRLTNSGRFCQEVLLTEQSYYLGIQNSVPVPADDAQLFEYYDPRIQTKSQYMPGRLRNTVVFLRYLLERFEQVAKAAEHTEVKDCQRTLDLLRKTFDKAIENMAKSWGRIVSEGARDKDPVYRERVEHYKTELLGMSKPNPDDGIA